MTKFKAAFIAIIAAMLVFFTAGGTMVAFAEENNLPEQEVTTETDEPTEEEEVTEEAPEPADEETGTLESVAANFVNYLKETFGADYEYYYNQIIEKWGSVEEYLLQFGEENIPEQYQTGWQTFVGWLGEYSVIWAPALAVVLVILVYIIGKKRFERIVKNAVDSKTTAMSVELNKQSKAQAATNRALKALLGNNEKFAGNAKELEESEKELNS